MVQADGIILGSPVSYWAMVYGQMPGDVQKDEEGLDTMKNLGQNMAYLLKALKERREEMQSTVQKTEESSEISQTVTEEENVSAGTLVVYYS